MEMYQVGDIVYREVQFVKGEITKIGDNWIEVKWPSGFTNVIPDTDEAYSHYVVCPKGFKPVIAFVRDR